jgi:hypothetical protein
MTWGRNISGYLYGGNILKTALYKKKFFFLYTIQRKLLQSGHL